MRLKQWRPTLIVLAGAVVVLLGISIAYGLTHPGPRRASAAGVTVHPVPHDAPGPVISIPASSMVLATQIGARISVQHGGNIPTRFTIWRDPFEAQWVGTTSTGDQFFLGPQGVYKSDLYMVLFVWKADGSFKSATIADVGPNPSKAESDAAKQAMLGTLGAFRRTDLFIQPFAVKAFGLHFGFVPRFDDSSDPTSRVWIELLPANNMAFTAPWTYGHYDT